MKHPLTGLVLWVFAAVAPASCGGSSGNSGGAFDAGSDDGTTSNDGSGSSSGADSGSGGGADSGSGSGADSGSSEGMDAAPDATPQDSGGIQETSAGQDATGEDAAFLDAAASPDVIGADGSDGARAEAGVDASSSPPTVDDVVVIATNPDNGATPYNTGTATLRLTGTSFSTVQCPAGVALADLDGAGAAVGTGATTCSIDSDTQITATFPAGIRTNGSTGWSVLVTNAHGANASSAVAFVPRAGLLVSEVFTGTSGSASHEYVEVYNPTATSIDPSSAGIGLHLHILSTGVDTDKALTTVRELGIQSHGFLLFASSASTNTDAWFLHTDYTYDTASGASLVANGGVYLSLSSTNNVKVLDKVGWGAQPAPGYEGTALTSVPSNESVERKPAGGAGHATDTDVNSADFNAPSTTIEAFGTLDPPQP